MKTFLVKLLLGAFIALASINIGVIQPITSVYAAEQTESEKNQQQPEQPKNEHSGHH